MKEHELPSPNEMQMRTAVRGYEVRLNTGRRWPKVILFVVMVAALYGIIRIFG